MKNRNSLDIRSIASALLKIVWKRGLRERLIGAGLDVHPVSFYSPIPTPDEVEHSFEYEGDGMPFRDDKLFDNELLLHFLDRLQTFAEEFNAPVEGAADGSEGFFWTNDKYGYADAMAYYAMIRLLKPRRILEIGAGFSTMVADKAIQANGTGEILVIEPYPAPYLRKIPSIFQLYEKKAQEFPVQFFNENLNDGDFFFIDSTHAVKNGSDCVYLYLKILPALIPSLVYHVHDIFLPRSYPKKWVQELHIYWTEQYLLYAYLLGSSRYRIDFGSSWHESINNSRFKEFMGNKATAGGSSLWFHDIALPMND